MCYIDVHKFLRMLIGSEKTPMFAFLLFYIKFTSGVITPAAAKARSAQVLRNSPRTMPLSSSWSQDTLNPFSTRKNKLFPKLTYCWLHTTSDLRQILSYTSNKTSLVRAPKATFSNNAFSFSEHG